MRRFSQRSSLVTLSEINITPLLDLAFVLLIIFVITTPLLEQSIRLNLPKGGTASPRINPHDIRTVEITPQGAYRLQKQPMRLDRVEAELLRDFQANPELIVYIRADGDGAIKYLYPLLDLCQKNRIKTSLATEPPKR